jgi:nitroimidazol reductase NimA-like FMN-containing flavoprotein (pyridoxamine 5'-phosphate oxidase superfamily)
MAVLDGGTGLEYLPEPTCWNLLSRAKVGRLGVLVDSAPEIHPVSFAVDGQTIVFRTDGGSKLRGVHRSPSVCFEVDRFDEDRAGGWSIMVRGRAVELETAEDLRTVLWMPLRPWPLGREPHWIRILPAEVTGRRISARDEV